MHSLLDNPRADAAAAISHRKALPCTSCADSLRRRPAAWHPIHEISDPPSTHSTPRDQLTWWRFCWHPLHEISSRGGDFPGTLTDLLHGRGGTGGARRTAI